MSDSDLIDEVAKTRQPGAPERSPRTHYDQLLLPPGDSGDSVAAVHGAGSENAGEAFRRLGQLMQSVLDSIGDGVAVTDDQGRFLLFNPAARQILRLPAEFASIPAAEWSRYFGLFLPDQVTPYPTHELPLSRAMRGDNVTAADLYMRNDRFQEGAWLSVTARPLRDESGRIHGGVAVFRDVTRWKAQLAVTSVLAESRTLSEATPRILQAICNSTGWQVGAIWHVDAAAGLLRCVDTWQSGEEFSPFTRAIQAITFGPGAGLPGRVWESGHPCWIANLAWDDNFPRNPLAAQCGLHSALAFPIPQDHKVIGVVEFFARELRPPDSELQSMFDSLGSQIGQFLARQSSEQQLRTSRERFELAVQGAGDGLWDWDVRTGEVFFSPRWKSMLGYEDHELPNKFETWASLLHPDERELAMEKLQQHFVGDLPVYEVEHRLQHKDGTYRWILARGAVLRDAEGKPYRLAGSHRDITEKKKTELALLDSEALYHSLVESLPLNVVRKDLHGRFIFCNQRFLETCGHTAEELHGTTDRDIYPPELADKYRRDDQRVFETGQVFEDIEEHCKPNGDKIYVQVLKSPVRDSHGAVVGTQAIFWDVTPRKLAEEALQRAKAAAESASNAKSQFLANMSHEIRTPMNAIVGMSELLIDTPLDDEQRDFVQTVKKSADHLLCVINDVLDFSKIEAGKLDLDLQPFNLRECIGDTLYTLAIKAQRRGLELACRIDPDVPCDLMGDSVRLRQVLMNLVGNAIKFTEHGEVVAHVSRVSGGMVSGKRSECLSTDHPPLTTDHSPLTLPPLTPHPSPLTTELHFEVSDTGIGIPGDKLGSIFEPFVQVDGSMTRRYRGTGLGLSISSRLVEIMGGRIWVESELGKGSAFHFTVRLECREAGADDLETIDAQRLCGLAVLVVDDNATNRRILQETLGHWGMRPTVVADGAAALLELQRASRQGEPFPLVLLDAHMPGMSGFTLAEKIQEQPELAGAAVMMLSSAGQSGEVSRCKELGIGSYLTKPIKQADLWRALLLALGRSVSVPHASPPPLGAVLKTLRVLVVEDNLVNQKLAVRLLEKRGHTVTVAHDGLEGLIALGMDGRSVPVADPVPFDIVLMDLQMPEMDGLEATHRIRAWESRHGGHIPIVAMTAYAMRSDQERCLAAGMDAFITKPVKVQELHGVIERLAAQEHHDASAVTESRPALAEVLDWNAALEYVGGDEKLLRELFGVFREECPRWLVELREAVTRQDAVAVQRAAHKLKGALGNFGAGPAAVAAARLESLARDKKLGEVEPAFRVLDKELERLMPALEPA